LSIRKFLTLLLLLPLGVGDENPEPVLAHLKVRVKPAREQKKQKTFDPRINLGVVIDLRAIDRSTYRRLFERGVTWDLR
jgi:predicted secreted protein